jgi:hypothetical protein
MRIMQGVGFSKELEVWIGSCRYDWNVFITRLSVLFLLEVTMINTYCIDPNDHDYFAPHKIQCPMKILELGADII